MAEGDQEVVIHPDELELTHEQVEVLRDMLTRQIEEAAAPEAPPAPPPERVPAVEEEMVRRPLVWFPPWLFAVPITGIERTQATQFFSINGKAAGIDLGAMVKVDVQASGRFDLTAKRLVALEWVQKDERDQGYIPGSRHVPYRLVRACCADIPHDRSLRPPRLPGGRGCR